MIDIVLKVEFELTRENIQHDAWKWLYAVMEQHELYKSDKDQLATHFRLILTNFLMLVLLHKVTTFVAIEIWHEKYFNYHVRVGSEY